MLTDEKKTELLKLIEQYGEAQYELGINVGEKNQNNDKNKACFMVHLGNL